MRNVLFASLFLPIMAMAQTKPTTVGQPGVFVPTITNSAAAASPTPIPTPAPNPWKISFSADYQGPALGNLTDITKTQFPGQAPTPVTSFDSLKIGYSVAKNVTIGTQFHGGYTVDSTAGGFTFYDQRFYTQWNHMIETSDLDITGKFVVEVPTSGYSRGLGEIISFQFNTNVELKTSLRNWSFTFATSLQPFFYSDPYGDGSGKMDLYFGIFPYITVDLVPNIQLLFEGNFDGNHNYVANFYDFQSAYSDYIDIGPLFTLGPHVNTNIALRFFTDEISFKAAALYANIGVAL